MARLKLQHSRQRPPSKRRGKRYTREVPGKSVFLPEKEHLVRMIAMRGADDDEIADTFGVPRETFQAWRKLYPTMNDALEKGRLVADADVVFALYREATGYCYTEEQAVGGKEPTVLEVKKCARPSVDAQKYWLNNRQPENWRSSSTSHVAGGTRKDDAPLGIKVETRDELIDSIVAMLASKPDGLEKPKRATDERAKA